MGAGSSNPAAECIEVPEVCVQQLLGKAGAKNPLWLVCACEELKIKFATATMEKGKNSSSLSPVQAALQDIATYPDDLLGLLQRKLARVEKGTDVTRMVAALCLLECSRHGLTGIELRALLVNEHQCRFEESGCGDDDEKALVDAARSGEDREDDQNAQSLKFTLHAFAQVAVQERPMRPPGGPNNKTDDNAMQPQKEAATSAAPETRLLSEEQWLPIYRVLKPFLRPCGDVGSDGHFDFFHRSVSKSVRLRYLSREEVAPEPEASLPEPSISPSRGVCRPAERCYTFWHGRLADFFEGSEDSQRRAEELPYHLEKVLDNSRLLRSLVQWSVFRRMCGHSGCFDLMRYCRSAGGYVCVASALREQLRLWESEISEEELARRQCAVAEFLTKAGQTGHTLAILDESPEAETEKPLQPATRARRLGLLADALLCHACFTSGTPNLGPRVVAMLEQSVALWRSCRKGVVDVDGVDEGQQLDEAALGQDLSNLCYQYGQNGKLQEAEKAGRESQEIFRRLRHPRLAQTEQHLAHVFKSYQNPEQALVLYLQSVATFERTGAATFDSEYACSLSSVGLLILDMDFHREGGVQGSVRWPVVLAYLRAAVAACEAITGREHPEAIYYRDLLTQILWGAGELAQATAVRDGAHVEVSVGDINAMKSVS